MTITNCANNYGPYQFPEKVIPLFATNALDDRELPLYASTQNRREWIHVLDHCTAIEAVLERGEVGETYHVGTGVERPTRWIADDVSRAGDQQPSRRSSPTGPVTTGGTCSTSSKIQRAFGVRSQRSRLEVGLEATVQWYADQF